MVTLMLCGLIWTAPIPDARGKDEDIRVVVGKRETDKKDGSIGRGETTSRDREEGETTSRDREEGNTGQGETDKGEGTRDKEKMDKEKASPRLISLSPLGSPTGTGILMFTDPGCSPCLVCKSEFPALSDIGWTFGGPLPTSPVHVYILDYSTHPALASKYGITSLPTFIMLEDGKEIRRQTGFTKEARLGATLERVWYGRK